MRRILLCRYLLKNYSNRNILEMKLGRLIVLVLMCVGFVAGCSSKKEEPKKADTNEVQDMNIPKNSE